jgi:hypothetical protein
MARAGLMALGVGLLVPLAGCSSTALAPGSVSMERALEQTARGGLDAMAKQLTGALASPGAFGTAPPHVPVVVPPDIRRVWVPTHQSSEGELVSGHWVYLRLTDFRWLLEAGPVSERWPAGVLPEGASAPPVSGSSAPGMSAVPWVEGAPPSAAGGTATSAGRLNTPAAPASSPPGGGGRR